MKANVFFNANYLFSFPSKTRSERSGFEVPGEFAQRYAHVAWKLDGSAHEKRVRRT